MDTETLLALVTSLLPPATTIDPDVILEALVQSNGDATAAARLLSTSRTVLSTSVLTSSSTKPSSLSTSKKPETPGSKRKRLNLDGWLRSAAHQSPPIPKRAKASDESNTREEFDLKHRSKALHEVNPRNKSKISAITSGTSSTSYATNKPPSIVASPGNAKCKNPVNLMSVLRQPPSPQKKSIPRLPPLTLSTPALVAEHTPCTLHLAVLPPELACRLFYTMLDASRSWKRNTWWLFDRLVESPHLTSFYARKNDGVDTDESWQEAAQFWYNGRRTDPPVVFPPEMEEACQYIERVVNEEMRKRKRYQLEWRGSGNRDDDFIWRANVAASNCYQGAKESVGPHSDQLTYLGPYPTIASLSLGTARNFSLREVIPTDESEVRKARTFTIPLQHNSLTIMHASCQEKFKHSVPTQSAIDLFRPPLPREPSMEIEPTNCRINITFRFYRPDFRPPSIPRCKCGVPTILRPDMKNRTDGTTDKYWWTCYAGAQNDGKGCNFWKVMDMKAEGRSVST